MLGMNAVQLNARQLNLTSAHNLNIFGRLLVMMPDMQACHTPCSIIVGREFQLTHPLIERPIINEVVYAIY